MAEIYNRQLHLTGLASVFMDGADVARIFDQLRPLFDRGFLAPGREDVAAREQCRGLPDGARRSAGIKQVLLPIGGAADVPFRIMFDLTWFWREDGRRALHR